MKYVKKLTSIMLAFMVCCGLFVFGNTNIIAYADGELTGELLAISNFGNVTISITKADMEANDYEFGDMVTVSFPGKSIDIPYCSNYSEVDAGSIGLFGTASRDEVTLAINSGNFAASYEIAEKITHEDNSIEWKYNNGISEAIIFTVSMKEKKGYYNEYIVRQLTYTDDRADYQNLSDEQFANFRMVKTTGIKEGVLYRSASPVDNKRNRNAENDAAYRMHGIEYVMNLTDDETTLLNFKGFNDTYYSGINYIALNMGVDYTEDDFKKKLKDGLQFFAENKGIYAVHCLEGKDRTGFVIALLEFLMGASYEEAEDDYMITFYNYYGVTKESEKYEVIASTNFENLIRRAFGVDDVKNADLKKLAEDYIFSTGLSEDDLNALKSNLAEPKQDTSSQTNNNTSPETGDDTVEVFVILLLLLFAGCVPMLLKKRSTL